MKGYILRIKKFKSFSRLEIALVDQTKKIFVNTTKLFKILDLIDIDSQKLIATSSLPLPFNRNDLTLSEDIKEKYKYLYFKFFPEKLSVFFELSRLRVLLSQYLYKEGFVYIDTPLLVSRNSSEGARLFSVNGFKKEEFFLSQSPQIFKQILISSGFGKYFQFSKCFRLENMREDRVFEFTQIDLELRISSFEQLLLLAKKILKKISKILKEKISFIEYDYTTFFSLFPSEKLSFLVPFKIQKGLLILKKKVSNEQFQKFISLFEKKANIKKEVVLKQIFLKKELLSINISFLKETSSFRLLHFFEEKKGKNICLILKRFPPEETSIFIKPEYSFDFVLNGEEICSGGLRDLDPKNFENKEELDFFKNFLSFSTPSHGGFAFGLERIFLGLRKVASLKELFFFPKSKKGKSFIEQ